MKLDVLVLEEELLVAREKASGKSQSNLNRSARRDTLDRDCKSIRTVSFDRDDYEAHI